MTRTHSATKRRSSQQAVLEFLTKFVDRILFIDDFHYVPQETQTLIMRGLKEAVFNGTRVLLASIPAHALDAVRSEREMTKRVKQLPIPLWKDKELREIAARGLEALNCAAPTAVLDRLARECFGSPFLMREFSLHFCRENGIRERQEQPTLIRALEDWPRFFRDRALDAEQPAVTLLAKGPNARKARKEWRLEGGRTVDIYGVVLAALASTGATSPVSYEDLRKALRSVVDGSSPRKAEVVRVLNQMTRIAREKIKGDPMIEFDSEYELIHISDPYFAFFLKWSIRH